MRHLVSLALASALLACGGGDDPPPTALARLQRVNQVTPFDSYSVPGLTLHRVAVVGVADLSDVWIVGVEEGSDRLVEGASLFVRMRDGLEPEELARRALDTLLRQQGHAPLEPGGDRSPFASEAEWALIRAPRVEGGSLFFWAMRGEMQPELVRHRVDLETGRLETSPVGELVPPPEPAPEGEATCEPLAACGCWVECARVVADGDHHFRVLDGPSAGRTLRRLEDCATIEGARSCRRVCDSDAPDAACRDGLVPDEESCTEACPPSEAPYHCEAASSGCFRVAHPRRAARSRSGSQSLDGPAP